MKLKFLDLSGQLPLYEDVFREVLRITSSQQIPFFVVGAIARDLILGAYGIESRRLTEDIDCGIQLASWEQFERVKNALIQTRRFEPDPREQQRLFHKNGVKIDLVPFGGIETQGRIAWPPDGAFVMVTLGMEEAYKNTISIRLAQDVEIEVTSLPGLALMKLVAWNDQPFSRGKDAIDLGFVMANYLDAGNSDRILGDEAEHGDLLNEDFDYELTGARLLGRDVGEILTPHSYDPVMKILESQTGEQRQYPLVQGMLKNFHGEFGKGLSMLESFKAGILDVRG